MGNHTNTNQTNLKYLKGTRVLSPSSSTLKGVQLITFVMVGLLTSFGISILSNLAFGGFFSNSAYAAFSASISRSGTVNLAESGSDSIRPTSSGTLGTGSDTVSVITNCTYSGYKLYVSATSTGGTDLTLPEDADYIPTSSTATGSETTLSRDTWGVGKTASAFSGLPAYTANAGTLTPFYTGTTSSSYDFYYGVNVSTAKTPGTYSGEVLYTVLMNDACLKYTLSFNGNSATTNNLSSQEITFDDTIDLSTISSSSKIARTGYTLTGWKDQNNNSYGITGTVDVNPTDATSVTLTAQWQANTYTVAYAAGSTGGACSVGSTAATYDRNVTLSSAKCTKTGYTQDGWSTSSSASNTRTYTMGQTLTKPNFVSTNGGTKTLYPHFVANSYTIAYAAGSTGGTCNVTSTSATYNANVTLSSTKCTKTGYTQDGWSTSSAASNTKTYNLGQTLTTPNFTSTADDTYTLYPHFTINTHTVTVSGGIIGTSGSTTTGTYNYGANVTITANSPSTGYHFTSWSSNNGGSFASSTSSQTTFTVPDANVTLTAGTAANTLSITYSANGGTGAASKTSETGYYGTNITMPTQNTLAKSGYDFLGWSLSSTATSATWTAGQTGVSPTAINSSFSSSTGLPATVYAVWQSSVSDCSSSVHPTTSTGCKMKDGNTWIYGNSGSILTWNTLCTSSDNCNSATYCPSGYSVPTKAIFDSLVSAQGSGSQLYSVLGLSSDRLFWSSTQLDSSSAYDLRVRSSSARVLYSSKTGSYYLLCYKQ